jgi:hypothetical protein
MTYRRSWARDFERSVRDHPDWPVVVTGGDSWFSFANEPNVVDYLDDPTGDGWRQRDWSLLRLENGSDELATALSAGHRGELRAVLDRVPVHALLWSGGGNDLIGADLLPLLKPWAAGAAAADCLDETRLERRLRRVEDSFRDLVDLVLDDGGDMKLYLNSYDYPLPLEKPVKLLGSKLAGPWLVRAFRERGYPPGDTLEREIPRLLIDRFCATIDRVAAGSRGRVVRVETRGAVGGDWADEIHPNGRAAQRVAARFEKALVKNQVIQATSSSR